jgi:ABC-type transport system involved in multi-copper enzyme maturation permease subunit
MTSISPSPASVPAKSAARRRFVASAFLVGVLGLLLTALLVTGEAMWGLLVVMLGTFFFLWPRRPVRPHIGPLFFYDLVRLARRGRSTLLRATYTLALFGALWLVYAERFPQHNPLERPFGPEPNVTIGDRARLAAGFAGALLFLQIAAAVVLTPVYVASAIAEEKEKRTLELLFTTHLLDSEIVLGKLFSRLAHLAGILLAGLPILCLLEWWGGVDFGIILAGTAVTGITLLSVGSVSMLWSVVCRSVMTAVLGSYATVIGVTLGCICSTVASPLGFLVELQQQSGMPILPFFFHRNWAGIDYYVPNQAAIFAREQLIAMVFGYAAVHGTMALGCLATAISHLRRSNLARQSRNAIVVRVQNQDQVDGPRQSALVPVGPRFPVTDHALLWKEVYHGAGPSAGWGFWPVYRYVLIISLPILGLFIIPLYHEAIVGVGTFSQGQVEPRVVRQSLTQFARTATVILAGLWCILLSLRAAAAISRERERRTLDSLLSLPLTRREILGAAWLGSILRYRLLAPCLAAVWTLAILATAIHPLAVPYLFLAVAVHLAFFSSLGIWISLVSRNTLWAHFSIVLMLLLVFLGWWVVRAYSTMLLGIVPGSSSWWGRFVEIGLSPDRTWRHLCSDWAHFPGMASLENLHEPFGVAVAGLWLYAALAGLLWLAACRRLRRLAGGRSS